MTKNKTKTPQMHFILKDTGNEAATHGSSSLLKTDPSLEWHTDLNLQSDLVFWKIRMLSLLKTIRRTMQYLSCSFVGGCFFFCQEEEYYAYL